MLFSRLKKIFIRLVYLALSAYVICCSARFASPESSDSERGAAAPMTKSTRSAVCEALPASLEASAETVGLLFARDPSDEPLYTVGIFAGKLAVYGADSDAPLEISGVSVAALPPLDREYLTSGIAVYSEDELARVLADYTS